MMLDRIIRYMIHPLRYALWNLSKLTISVSLFSIIIILGWAYLILICLPIRSDKNRLTVLRILKRMIEWYPARILCGLIQKSTILVSLMKCLGFNLSSETHIWMMLSCDSFGILSMALRIKLIIVLIDFWRLNILLK